MIVRFSMGRTKKLPLAAFVATPLHLSNSCFRCPIFLLGGVRLYHQPIRSAIDGRRLFAMWPFLLLGFWGLARTSGSIAHGGKAIFFFLLQNEHHKGGFRWNSKLKPPPPEIWFLPFRI